MALEWRGNNLYYYEKERCGKTVRSIYAGKGEMAMLFHDLKQLQQREEVEEKQRKNSEKLRQRVSDEKFESIVNGFSERVLIFVEAFLLINGFHQHKRQWRKKRNG